MLQLLLEKPASAADPRLCRTEAELHDLGDLFVRPAVDVSEDDGDPIFLGQSRDRLANDLAAFVVNQLRIRYRPRVRRLKLNLSVVLRLEQPGQ